MEIFEKAFYRPGDEPDGPREELRIVGYTLAALTVRIGPGSSLADVGPGATLPVILTPYEVESWCLEVLTHGKVVARQGDVLHLALNDFVEVQPHGPPEEMSVSFEGLDLSITAFGQHPWFISHPIEFQLIGVSPGRFFLDFRRAHNKDVLVPGMELKLQLQVPRSGTFEARGRVERIWRQGERIQLSFTVLRPDAALLEEICLRVLEAGDRFPVEALLDAGLRLPQFKGRASSGIVFEPAGLKQVLELRRRAYLGKEGHRFSPDAPAESFQDGFDAFSAILVVRLGSLLIGTGRVVFNHGDLGQSELAALGFEVPARMREDGFVEASRFATDERFRKRDVFQIMLLLATRVAYSTGHRYVLMDCEDHLLPVYRKMGASRVGKRIRHPWENIELNVVYFDLERLLRKMSVLKHVPGLKGKFAPLSREVERAVLKGVPAPFKGRESR